MDNWWLNAVWSITPTVLIGIFFFVVMRLILRADRTERRVYREMEAQERERMGLPPRTEKPTASDARS
ncbi:hypothetical protein GCM10009847_00640 [Leucobacter tardus]|uniref:Uncharacterized protein n=1 Tax=Leucobacter tardus TaxID=501483 RepID=A0A939QF38_9MICO|nr:hypothetical protein [Leucobacter tardus]MBO2990977.1 hypothetical protein [Leucobacter tardus]